MLDSWLLIQGDFFNWPPSKNHKFKKKLEYPDWPPPKSSKCQPVSNCFRTGPPLKSLSAGLAPPSPLKFLSMGIPPYSILC